MHRSTDAFSQNQLLGRGVNIIGYDSALWRSWSRAECRASTSGDQ